MLLLWTTYVGEESLVNNQEMNELKEVMPSSTHCLLVAQVTESESNLTESNLTKSNLTMSNLAM